MNEVCMLTHSMTPNQISAASGPTTGGRIFCAIGAIIGRMMKAISKKSRKNARKKILKPYAAGDAEEYHRKTGRADQDEYHHGGDAHRGLVALLDQVAQFGNPHRLETDPDHSQIGHRERALEEQAFGDEHPDDGADAAGDHASDQHR